jgi:hypothetical protein
MRYWGFFAAKLAVAGCVLWGLLALLNWKWPPVPDQSFVPGRFGYNLAFTIVVGVWFLLCAGAVYLAIWDQRYRCRVCLRRLRMPIETGSWGRMLLFGRPRIEYICPYGHGTLREDEVQISGLEGPEWTPHADLWDELCSFTKESDRRS